MSQSIRETPMPPPGTTSAQPPCGDDENTLVGAIRGNPATRACSASYKRLFLGEAECHSALPNILFSRESFAALRAAWQRLAPLAVRVLVLSLVLLAFAIRVYQLEAQSLWSDEGLSLYRARQSLGANLRNEIQIQGAVTTDTNPPLYFLNLAALRAAAGETEFALRFLSVFWGVLTVPLLFVTGRRLLRSDLGGLCAAALGALSPFYVWHSQELRMYPMTVDLAILSVLALTYVAPLDLSRPRREAESCPRRAGPYLLYALTTAALLYTHYSGFYLLAFEGVVLLAAILLRRRWTVILGLGLATLAATPLILYAIQRLGAGKEPYYGGFTLGRLAHELASTFSLGWTFPPRRPAEQLLVPLGLLCLGLLLLTWRRRWGVLLYLAGWLLLPVAAIFAVSLVKSTYLGPRHLLVASPAFYLAQAAGVAGLSRRWRPLGLAALGVILVGMAAGLRLQFSHPDFVKDDIRGAAAYLSRRVRPDDVVVLHDAIITPTFDYYYAGAAPRIVIPTYPPEGAEETVARFRQAAESHGRLWFLYGPPPLSGFSAQTLPAWADEHLFKWSDQGFEGLNFYVGVSAYTAAPPLPEAPPEGANPVEHSWPSGLRLLAYRSPAEAAVGGGGWFTFYWVQERAVDTDYVLRLELRDAADREWAFVAGPVLDFFPASDWPVGQVVRQEQFLPLPPGLPPTSYTLTLSLLEAPADRSLSRAERAAQSQPIGQAVPLGPVRVARPATPLDPRQLDLPTWLFPLSLGDGLELLGVALPDGPFRPGHPVWVRLAWGVEEAPSADYALQARLLDRQGRVRAEAQGEPSAAGFATCAWRPGDLLYGAAYIGIPTDAQPGPYQLQARLLEPESEHSPAGWATLGRVQVEAWPFLSDMPPAEHHLDDVRLGEGIRLRGYDLSQTDQGLDLTLYWQAEAEVETDYVVLAHLGLPDAAPVAQTDGIPAGWLRPTSGWRPGEIIVDPHHLDLPPDAPPGTYTLYAGLYTEQGRLPVWVDGQPVPGDRVPLQAIQLDGGQ